MFVIGCAFAMLAFVVQDYYHTATPADFEPRGFHGHGSYFLALLATSWLAARTLQRPTLWLSLATLGVLMGIVWTAVSLQVSHALGDADDLRVGAWNILLAMAGFVAVFRAVGFLSASTAPARRLGASLVFVLLMAGPWYWQQESWVWYPPDEDEVEDLTQIAAPRATGSGAVTGAGARNGTGADKAQAQASPTFDAEAVLYQQPALVQRAIEGIRAQTPGAIDLFGIGFAGDGNERVFRNEVEFFEQLMSKRFDAAARTVSLINSPRTVDAVPLATLTNLKLALDGVAARMDPTEDVLVLFLTSHGSEDHLLYVGMKPLPLRQIRPVDLRRSLDKSGIQWRVIVVSACYSGGFVDALRDDRTLVITAARRDRTSFGCGSASEVTWFGKAFLVNALNQTTDFERGFDLASRQIREWELADSETPSVPQLVGGWAIRQHLQTWRKTARGGEPVPFKPR